MNNISKEQVRKSQAVGSVSELPITLGGGDLTAYASMSKREVTDFPS